jgi:hypothetical protein
MVVDAQRWSPTRTVVAAAALAGLACARPLGSAVDRERRPAEPRSGSGAATGAGAEAAVGPAVAPRAPARYAGTPDPAVTPPERRDSPSCQEVDPGPAVLRRLTRFEYNNTVRDLLEDQSRPADDFPAEEKRDGFDNNAEALTVSPLLGEQYLLAAERLAAAYMDRRDDEAIAKAHGCDLGTAKGEDACASKMLASLARRAYRRPAPDADMQTLLQVYAAGKKLAAGTGERGFRNGLRLALSAMLQSPRFLYRMEEGVPPRAGETVVRLDPWDTASRLSYLLWATAPDKALLDAAERGELATREQIAAQAKRLLGDRKARAMVARFHEQWLDMERIEGAEKDPSVYPTFNKGIAALMREETDRFLDHVVWEGAGDLETIFTAAYTFVDDTLARFYGLGPLDLPRNKEGNRRNQFMRVALDGGKRAGLLTQGTFMAGLANANQTSPVRRGQFVRERLLCEELPPPPPNAMIELPPLDPKLTTRERFEDHALDVGCAGCHDKMDPIGLGFESFDGVGLWRDSENGKPLDASGEVVGMREGAFVGAVDLARRLARSEEVRACLSRRWFEYAYARELLADTSDACSLDVIRRRFAAGGYKIKDLVATLVETDAFLYRRVAAASAGGAP